MKITKYVHSCLVVETDGRVALFDPGSFSWDSGLFDVDTLAQLDEIIITHEHPDHCHLPFLQALIAKFPQVQLTTNSSVAAKLRAVGLMKVSTTSSMSVQLFTAAHESNEPLGPTPDNIGFHYMNRLTNPGDSFMVDETKDILILPVTAPWGALTRAAALAVELKPKYILPVHDWHWSVVARQQAYERLVTFFGGLGITFVPLVDGRSVDI